MKVEILHITDCPNWEEAGRRVSAALAVSGYAAVLVEYRLIETSEDAAESGFAGSPTITRDGVDLFPSEGATSDLACRVYFGPDGLAGLPTTEQLVEALAH